MANKGVISSRIAYLDNFRALCILGMIFCHSVIYGVREDSYDPAYFFGNHVLGDWPAAVFLTISGFMLEYRQSATGKLLKRGLFLIGVGMLLAVLNDGWQNFFECDVLVVIGVSSMLYPLVRGRSVGLLSAVVVGILLVTAALHSWLDYHTHWGGKDAVVSYGGVLLDPGGEYEAGAVSLGTMAKALFFNGYFPILPWLSFSLLGIVLAKREWPVRWLGAVGALLVVWAIVGTCFVALSFYPLSTLFNVLLIGAVLLLFAVRGLFDFTVWPLALLSRYSLSAYVLQYVILDIVARSTGQFVEAWVGYALGVAVTLAVVIVLLGIEKTGGKVSLETALKRFAG